MNPFVTFPQRQKSHPVDMRVEEMTMTRVHYTACHYVPLCFKVDPVHLSRIADRLRMT